MDLLYAVLVGPFRDMLTAPTFLAEVLIGGVAAGLMYSLVALGFVLIFKASGVFNFAQGVMVLFAALTLVGDARAALTWGPLGMLDDGGGCSVEPDLAGIDAEVAEEFHAVSRHLAGIIGQDHVGARDQRIEDAVAKAGLVRAAGAGRDEIDMAVGEGLAVRDPADRPRRTLACLDLCEICRGLLVEIALAGE